MTDSSILAAPYILATGREILPIGGYQGGVPAPSLSEIQRRIAAEEVRIFVVPPVSGDPRIVWITTHCKPLASGQERKTSTSPEPYDCAGA